jgi:predicted nuclease of predicted toxin-antitoxin system
VLRLLADEDFNGDITRGLRYHRPDLDLIRVQDIGLRSAPDQVVRERAALDDRQLLTHDVRTMRDFAYQRVQQGEPMPGVFVVEQDFSVGQAIEDILLLVECSIQGEWEAQVLHLPL